MTIMEVLLILVVAGIGLWLVNNYIPMDGKIKKILNIFGVFGTSANIRIGK